MSENNQKVNSPESGDGVVYVQICVGSSCHLKGSPEVVEKMQELIREYELEDRIILLGSFCAERCNRVGVTIIVNDEVFEGITPVETRAFFKEHILSIIE